MTDQNREKDGGSNRTPDHPAGWPPLPRWAASRPIRLSPPIVQNGVVRDRAVPAGPDAITAGWVTELLGDMHDIGPVVRIGEDYGLPP